MKPEPLCDQILRRLEDGPLSYPEIAWGLQISVSCARTTGSTNRAMGYMEPVETRPTKFKRLTRYQITPEGRERLETLDMNGITCPSCNSRTEIIETRKVAGGQRRRRACQCGVRVTTMETIVPTTASQKIAP